MTQNIIVTFRPGRQVGEVVGEIVAGSDSRKICLVERAYRGVAPKAGETWVCSLVRDTNPGQRNGVNLVRPIKRPTWRMVETGETLGDTKQHKLQCVECPELHETHADKATRQELTVRNAPYEAARLKAERFASAPWSKLVEEYGAPLSVIPTEGCATYFVVTFSGGYTRKRYAEEVAQCLPNKRTATGAWRWRNNARHLVEAEYANDAFPVVKTWEVVAFTHCPPEEKHALPEATRVAIVEAFREATGTPEAFADRLWAERAMHRGGLDKIVHALTVFGSPGEMRIAGRSYRGQIYEGPSSDERRPGGYFTGTIDSSALTLCRFTGEVEEWGRMGRGWVYLPQSQELDLARYGRISSTMSDAEIRQTGSAVERKRLTDAVIAPTLTESSAPHAEYRPGVSTEEWLTRANTRLTALAQAELERLETQIRKGIAAAQAEYDEYHRLATEIIALRKETQALETRCVHACLQTERGYYGCYLGRDGLEELRRARDHMAEWIPATEEALATELRRRGEQEIAARLDKEARAKALADAMSAPATPMPWYVVDMSDEEVEKLTGRTFGEGIGPRVAGHTNKFLPGDQALVAIRVGGGRVNRYSFHVKVSGLVNLWGPNSAFYESAGGRHATDILGLVEAEDWYVAVTNLERGEVIGYTLYTKEGIGHLTPRTWEDEDGWHSNPWNEEGSEGPSERRIREVFGLMGGGVTPKPQPTPEPAPPPVEATPAAPAQVAATLNALKARFGGKNKR